MIKLVKYIVLLVLIALMGWAVSWSSHKATVECCTGIDVEVINADATSFVTPEGIKEEIARMGFKPVGQPVGRINTDLIESKLQNSEFLESAECVLTANNRLLIRVSQIIPVLRVFDGNTSYYMNHAGKRMPAIPSFYADVPVVQGTFSNRYPATRLLPLVEHIAGDSLLSALVTMISVRDSNNVFIIPNIAGHVVNIGPVDNLQSKFDRLTSFYRKVLPFKGYEHYDTISVKWNGQVVATRRGHKPKPKIEVDSTDYVDETPLSVVIGNTTTVAPSDDPKQTNR